jgi:hypothetical protein
MFFGTLAIGWSLRPTGMPNLAILAIQISSGAAIYVLAALVAARPMSMTLIRLVLAGTRRGPVAS